MQPISEILTRLGLTESETTVYLAMCRGINKARDITKVTRLKRPTVYYALSRLEERGLIHRTGSLTSARFGVEPAERLVTIAKRQVADAAALEQEIAALAPSLAQASTPGERPHVAFYEGVEAVKNVIMETLYCRDRRIDSIAPSDNFFWQIGDSFAGKYVAERFTRKIRTRNLWESPIDPKKYRKEYYEDVSEIRIMPKATHGKFKTTIFLYDDKALYISSLKNAYALLVTSQEHHDTMKALFDGLWSSSKTAQ